VLAALISQLVAQASLAGATDVATLELRSWPDHEEVLRAVDRARELSSRGGEAIAELGGGWVGEEALSIALYCCLLGHDFEETVLRAVNHSGDSDSTGAIAGNIMGALLGLDAIPLRWREGVELGIEIVAVADDLRGVREGSLSDLRRYPPT
jgi:ADP-ribosylglycohydrolase